MFSARPKVPSNQAQLDLYLRSPAIRIHHKESASFRAVEALQQERFCRLQKNIQVIVQPEPIDPGDAVATLP